MITIKTKKILLIVLCFVLLLGCLSVLAGAQEAESAASEAEHEWSAYNGKKIGVLTGSIHDAYAKKYFPDSELLYYRKDSGSERFFTSVSELNDPNVVIGTLLGSNFEAYRNTAAPKAQLKYFNTTSDLLFALSVGQIDSVLIDDLMARYLSANVEGLTYLEEPIEPIQGQAFIFGNTEFDTKLMAQMNEFTAKLQQDGTLNELIFKWCRGEAADAEAAYDTEGPNGTIRIATNAENPPGVYLSNGKVVGYEPEILSLFCKEYGYGMEFTDMNFPGIIPAVLSGQCNIGAATISVTEERKETVRFAEAYYSAGGLALIRKPVEKAGFFQSIAASFERTFIRESRWKLILDGVCTTVVISVCAAALGTVLGFGLCLLRRSKSRFLQGLTTVYIRIMQGMPLLVLVMILFYIVFANAGLSGMTVAIFAFALSFAAYVCEIIRTGIDGVEPGQTEAALALGYTKTQSFLKIVLPQAARSFLPVYQGEFISLVKMTSIVGYIAVEDLTKMSDIIRSRTYEAFFPLITTAILYFLISMALTSLLRLAARKLEPKRTVKGVKLQ